MTASTEGGSHDGNLRIWLQAPGRFRIEQRTLKRSPPTIKILDGERMWISTVGHDGRRNWVAKHGRPEGAAAIAQIKKDRDRFANLARFLSLSSLMGRGVVFESDGMFSKPPPGNDHLAGTWMKVRRRTATGERMAFLFAFEKSETGVVRATWPRAVLLPGNTKAKTPTEHYVLDGWRARGTRLPRRIQGLTWIPKRGGFVETFKAWPETLRINEGLDASKFRPPAEESG